MQPATEPTTAHATPDAIVVALERSHGQVIFGFARRLGLSSESASEVVQEALMRLFSALRGGTTITDAAAWTFRTAYRLAMDEHRQRARHSKLQLLERHRDHQGGDPADDHERAALWREVDRLPERQRAVLYLRYRADLPFESVSDILGITPSAARSHTTQAMATLRRRLNKKELD
jgi:RNA polymerase sigma factor (sigma-70 family)